MHEKKIVNNSVVSVTSNVLLMILGFLSRKVFITFLGEEVLGLNSLYANLLDLLNLADLGIGVAVQYQLYEPLVKKDYLRLSKILSATKKIYNIIGLFIIFAGVVLSSFIKYFIKETTFSDLFIQTSFVISAFGVATGYFFVHKRLFLQADENLGIVRIIDFFANLLTIVAAIISLIVFNNYFIYLVISASYQLLSNLLIYLYFEKKYPEIQHVNDCNTEGRLILRNLKNVVPLKISDYIYKSTDNIIVSKLLGLSAVAVYSTYMLIINGVMSLEYIVGNVVTSSAGKLLNEKKDKENVYNLYLLYQYVQFLLAATLTISMTNLISPFVKAWMGIRFVTEKQIIMLLMINFFIHSMYQPLNVLYGAMGKFKEDRNITIIGAMMNIFVSVFLGIKIGLPGIIVGTIVTDIYIWIIRSFQIVHIYFRGNIIHHYIKMAYYILCTIVGFILSYYLCNKITISQLALEMLIKSLICVISSIVCCVVMTSGFPELYQIKQFVSGKTGGKAL